MKTKAKQIRTTRAQRGIFLAATGNIESTGPNRYEVNTHTVSLNLNHCTCYDGKRHTCKHLIAASHYHQHGDLSISLAMIMAYGGGQLVETRKGGLGKYWRLKGNTLIGKPLPVEWATRPDGTERLYPAVIVEPFHKIGYDLIALTNSALVKEFAPELNHKCRIKSIAFLHAALAEHERRSAAAKQRKAQKLRKAA